MALTVRRVGQVDQDVGRAVDHVEIGQDVAVSADDDAGAEAALLARGALLALLRPLAELLAEEPAQQILVAWAALAVLEAGRRHARPALRPNRHDRGRGDLDDVGVRVAAAGDHRRCAPSGWS